LQGSRNVEWQGWGWHQLFRLADSQTQDCHALSRAHMHPPAALFPHRPPFQIHFPCPLFLFLPHALSIPRALPFPCALHLPGVERLPLGAHPAISTIVDHVRGADDMTLTGFRSFLTGTAPHSTPESGRQKERGARGRLPAWSAA